MAFTVVTPPKLPNFIDAWVQRRDGNMYPGAASPLAGTPRCSMASGMARLAGRDPLTGNRRDQFSHNL